MTEKQKLDQVGTAVLEWINHPDSDEPTLGPLAITLMERIADIVTEPTTDEPTP